jgi:hypothetical protein
MGRRTAILSAILFSILTACVAGVQAPNAADRASVTITGKVCYGYSTLLVNVPLYLFTWEQSSKIRETMRITEERIYSPKSDRIKRIKATFDFDNQVDRLVPKIPNVAKVNSDRSGRFRFPAVATRARYLIVTEFGQEDGVFFSARSTGVLQPGRKPRLDVMITTSPWQMEEGDCSKATLH